MPPFKDERAVQARVSAHRAEAGAGGSRREADQTRKTEKSRCGGTATGRTGLDRATAATLVATGTARMTLGAGTRTSTDVAVAAGSGRAEVREPGDSAQHGGAGWGPRGRGVPSSDAGACDGQSGMAAWDGVTDSGAAMAASQAPVELSTTAATIAAATALENRRTDPLYPQRHLPARP